MMSLSVHSINGRLLPLRSNLRKKNGRRKRRNQVKEYTQRRKSMHSSSQRRILSSKASPVQVVPYQCVPPPRARRDRNRFSFHQWVQDLSMQTLLYGSLRLRKIEVVAQLPLNSMAFQAKEVQCSTRLPHQFISNRCSRMEGSSKVAMQVATAAAVLMRVRI